MSVKSGLGVGKEAILKNTFQWPFQRVTTISLAPRNYSFDLHMISKVLVPFSRHFRIPANLCHFLPLVLQLA